MQPDQEGMLDVLHQHAALSHDVLLLEVTNKSYYDILHHKNSEIMD